LFDFAKISTMKRYSETGKWPLSIPFLLKSHYDIRVKTTLNGLLKKIPFFKKAPIHVLPFYYCGSLFRCGTRPWEYPWVLEALEHCPKGGTVLDVGCGSSEFLFQYLDRGLSVIGLDRIRSSEFPTSELSSEFVRKWESHIKFLNSDALNIPLDGNSIDAVVCISVMEHIIKSDDPSFHKKTFDEMKRILKPGGILIMTCDTFINPLVVFKGKCSWGEEGWSYAADIDYLGMRLLKPEMPIISKKLIDADEDTFFIPPDMYFDMKYGTGFELFGPYHRMTSIGYVLVK